MDAPPDLHVVSLHYNLRKGKTVTYSNPPDVEIPTKEAKYLLSQGKLKCEMLFHFSTEHDARMSVEPFLRAWEIDADLRWGRGEFRFHFDHSDIIDRTPLMPGQPRVLTASVGEFALATDTATVRVDRARYPDPPTDFRLNPDVETLWLRYQGYLEGKEPLFAMGYFCLNFLEANAGGRSKAAAYYHVHNSVLRKLGELASTRGDRLTARKAMVGNYRPLSGRESVWLEALLKLLIWRLGDTRNETSLSTITMHDLPQL